MRKLFVLSFLVLTWLSLTLGKAHATDGSLTGHVIMPGVNADLNEFKWINRPLVVFADSPSDPAFVEQMNLLTERLEELKERDVVVLTDTYPDARTALRQKLRPRGFMVVLIGKDGMIKLRKPVPWDVRELSRTIDKMPMRQQEIRDRRGDS